MAQLDGQSDASDDGESLSPDEDDANVVDPNAEPARHRIHCLYNKVCGHHRSVT